MTRHQLVSLIATTRHAAAPLWASSSILHAGYRLPLARNAAFSNSSSRDKNHNNSSAGVGDEADGSDVEVCCVDPRSVLSQADRQQGSGKLDDCTIKLPRSFLEKLPHGDLELGDADEPLNAWIWGRKAELFEYQLVGSHATRSGFSSIIRKRDLVQATGGTLPGLPTWQAFHQVVQDGAKGPTGPFLFTGRILESSQASVYVLPGADGKPEGLMVSSQAAEED